MPSSDPKQRKPNRPVCFNFEIPCEDCIQPVSFVDIPKYYTIGESIIVNYTILKTFNPKSEDWIGLFKCCHNIDKCFEFVAFRWAKKKPTFKYRPLCRTVVFYPEDLNIRPSEDKYIFLYLTTNERIIGQSSLFDFKLFSPTPQEILEILISAPQDYDKMEESENIAIEEEKQEAAVVATSEKKVNKSPATLVSIIRPELLPKPWHKKKEFYKISKPKYIIVEEHDQTKSDVESNIKDTYVEDRTKGVYSIKEESVAEIEDESLSKSQSKIHRVPDMIQVFEKLINQETTLVERVNSIEKKNEEFIRTQKTIQEQILQYMKNIEQLARPEKPVSLRSQETQYNKPRRKLPKIIQDAINTPKNLRYYFPKEDVKETFSGSEMTFKYLFNEIKQEKLKMVASEDEMEEKESEKESDFKKTTEVRKAATDISNLLKQLINQVEDNSTKRVGASVSLQNNIQKEDRKEINFDDFNQLLKKKRSLQVSVQPKSESTYSGSNIAIDLLFNQDSDQVIRDTNETEEKSASDYEKKNCSLKVTLSNEQDLNQSILQMTLNDFFVGICDNEPVFLDICKTDDSRKRKKGKSLKTMNMEFDETKADNNMETILTTTSDVVEQFKSRSLKEKLLTSSSYPSGNRQNPVACQRLQHLQEKMFSNKDSSKTFEDEKISNASMAVQIGSAEETSAAVLSSTPAVTRLTLLDSYEILASSRQDEFDYNRSVKQDHTARLLLIRDILQSDITDEEKILNIERLALSSSPTKFNKPKKQFQYRQWNKKNKKGPERKAKTEHETSDTSAESYKTNETTVSYPDPLTNNEFRGRKKSKKLKKNKFGRNKFTQTSEATTAKAESQTSESSLDDNSKFPKLVRKPLPSSIIPVLLSDSKNSIHASSEEDFKAKPILKKKISPLPQPTKECGQNARKTSVTFLVDASIQCETADFNKIYEETDTSNIKTLIDKHLVDLKSNQSDTTNQDDEPQGHKRERKVSFNTIILTSLFDNEENEKDDQKGTIRAIRPNGKSTWPLKEPVDTNTNKIPPVHQFLDFIEKEVKNVSENTAVLQNSLNKAMRIFKAEAVMLKDRSAEVLTKAIRAMSPQRIPLQRKPSPVDIEIKLTSVAPIAESKNRISRSRSNEPRLTATSSPKEMHKPVSENIVEIEKRKKAKLQVDEKSDLVKHQIKSDKDLEYLHKEIELQMFLQNFLRQVKTLTDKDSAEKEPEDGKQSEKSPTESFSPTFKKSAEDAKVSDDDTHQVRRTISDSLKVPQHYWSYDAVKKKDTPKVESNTSLINNPETPVVSLYSQSDCYKSSYTVGTQSLINSYCPPSNRSERQRISGMMLLQSFDSTISNIVKLYNNFTNYAYSSLLNPNLSIHPPKDETAFPKTDDEENGAFLNNESTPPYTCPNPSRSDSNESEEYRQPEVDYERRPSYDYEQMEKKISLPMSFSNSEEDAKHEKMTKNEKTEIDIIKSLFKSEEKINADPTLESSVQDKSEEMNAEIRETEAVIIPQHHPTIIVDEKERNDKIIEEMNRDLNDIKKDGSTSVEFCLTCSDEFPSLKSIIEANQKQERSNSERSKKRKKD